MTQFDDLLLRAFAAGYNRGYENARCDDGFATMRTSLTFDQWRASISGPDAAEAAPEFKIGDIAVVTTDAPDQFDWIRGKSVKISDHWFGCKLLVREPHRATTWAIDPKYLMRA